MHAPSSLVSIAAMIASGMVLTAAGPALAADAVPEAAQTCAACHGEAGVPTDKAIPVIWGQNRIYILNQLHDFKTGRRKNEIMSGIVESLTISDFQTLATYFSQQTWPEPTVGAPAAEVAKSANAVLDTINCNGCHQENYGGDTVRPRLAGQNEDYLIKTMTDFRSGERGNFITMTALMRERSDDEIKAMAQYLAGLKLPSSPAAAAK